MASTTTKRSSGRALIHLCTRFWPMKPAPPVIRTLCIHASCRPRDPLSRRRLIVCRRKAVNGSASVQLFGSQSRRSATLEPTDQRKHLAGAMAVGMLCHRPCLAGARDRFTRARILEEPLDRTEAIVDRAPDRNVAIGLEQRMQIVLEIGQQERADTRRLDDR